MSLVILKPQAQTPWPQQTFIYLSYRNISYVVYKKKDIHRYILFAHALLFFLLNMYIAYQNNNEISFLSPLHFDFNIFVINI